MHSLATITASQPHLTLFASTEELVPKINEIATKTNCAQKRKRDLQKEKEALQLQLDQERENSQKQAAELIKAKKARDEAASGAHESKLADAVTTLKDMIQANSKKKVEPKCEFSSNGIKLSPPEFESMCVDGLMNLSKIDPRCRDMIARDQMIDLFALHPSESYTAVINKKTVTTIDENTGVVTTVTTECPEVKSQQLKTRPDIFRMLYSFGQIYLQRYPEKSVGFLEVLGFLTKYAADYPLVIFTKLEKDIREFYVTNPDLSWNITRDDIKEFICQADHKHKKILLEAVNSTPRTQPLQQHQNNNQNSYAKKSLNFGSPQSGSRGKSSKKHKKCERCKNWNFRQCTSRYCDREHVCYDCGSSHHAEDCCRKGNPGRSDSGRRR